MRVAALMMMHNEPLWAPVWVRHYAREVGAENCVVLDHGSTDGSAAGLGVHVERVRRSALDEDARATLVSDVVRELLRGYDAVVHTDADELLVADPGRFADLRAYAAVAAEVTVAVGLDLQHLPDEEADWVPGQGVGAQRQWVRFSGAMCKPAMVRRPVRWAPGFHSCRVQGAEEGVAPEFGPLFLVHLRYADLGAGLARLARTRAQRFAREDLNPHQRVADQDFEAMVRSIAQLPRAGETSAEAVEPWVARMRQGWVREDGQLGLAGDVLWALPAAIRERL